MGFIPIGHINVSAKFEVRSFTCSWDKRGVAKLQTPNFEEREAIGGRGWYHSKESWWVPISPAYILFIYQHSFGRNFRLQFWVGVASPQFWGRGGHRGSGMVPFERELVSFYRPFIVSFPLSLRVSEILPFCSPARHFFPTPPQVSPKFLHVPLGIGGSPFCYKERRCWANCPCN